MFNGCRKREEEEQEVTKIDKDKRQGERQSTNKRSGRRIGMRVRENKM